MKCQNLFSGTRHPPPPPPKKKTNKKTNKKKKKKNEEILSVCRLLKFAHRVVKVNTSNICRNYLVTYFGQF